MAGSGDANRFDHVAVLEYILCMHVCMYVCMYVCTVYVNVLYDYKCMYCKYVCMYV